MSRADALPSSHQQICSDPRGYTVLHTGYTVPQYAPSDRNQGLPWVEDTAREAQVVPML